MVTLNRFNAMAEAGPSSSGAPRLRACYEKLEGSLAVETESPIKRGESGGLYKLPQH